MMPGEPTSEVAAGGPTDEPGRRRLGWATLLAVVVLYVASILVATYPAVVHCRTHLPVIAVADPVQHLFVFRWYERCWIEGRSPLVCSEIHQPVGAPLGLFTPLQLQSLVYLALSPFTDNDILVYNLILFFEFLFTGLGTFALAWRLTRHRWGATLGGLLAMLSGGMLINAMGGGTELLALGGFPLFLIGWMRFVDRPTRGRLAAAVGLFALLAASAPYYGVIGVVPAVLYVVDQALRQGRSGLPVWLTARMGWFAGFSLVVALTIPALFPSHVWAVLQGESLVRSRSEFERFGTTIWHYAIPWVSHRLNWLIPPFWTLPGIRDRATVYLGVVTLGLLGYAAVNRVSFRRSGFLWLCLAVMVVLSLGAHVTVGNHKIPLPALWLWEVFPPFRALRVPARFGYFASLCAAVIAAGALKHAWGRIAKPRRRVALGLVLTAVAVADLSMAPFPVQPLPAMPDAYEFIRRRDPEATIYEVHPAFRPVDYQALCAYWQHFHGLRTSAGYTGCTNHTYQQAAFASSPFSFKRLADPGFLAGPGPISIDLVTSTRFEDYAWLYLTAHGFDYLVLHRWTWEGRPVPETLDRLKERLRAGIIYEDEATVVIDREKLPKPSRPVVLCTTGWRERLFWRGGRAGIVDEEARLVVYNPSPDRPLRLTVEASSYLEPRMVRLLSGERELATWNVSPTARGSFQSPAFTLPAGLSELSLRSDGASRPVKPEYAPVEGDMTPFSLWVRSVSVATGGQTPKIQVSRSGTEDDGAVHR